jgi:hypothetical protein
MNAASNTKTAVGHVEGDVALASTADSPQFDPARLREIGWELSARLLGAFADDLVVLIPIRPRLAYLRWHVGDKGVRELSHAQGAEFRGAQLIVRIYDITDVAFDGFNAHRYIDVSATALTGNAYWPIPQSERTWLCEVGFRLANGIFSALARSTPMTPDRDRPASQVSLGGLYVGREFLPVSRVENILDAPAYEHLNAELPRITRTYPLALAMVHSPPQSTPRAKGGIRTVVDQLIEKCGEFPIRVEQFGEPLVISEADASVSERLVTHTASIVAALTKRHNAAPFDLLHCHDWPAIPACISAARALDVPFILSLHSTEQERAHGSEIRGVGALAERCERDGVVAADLVVVPRSSTRQQLTGRYEARDDKVLVIPDVQVDADTELADPRDIKVAWGFLNDRPLALFAGEISHAAGADLLVQAVLSVARTHREIQFVFAGAGPLKSELEMQTANAGLGDRCKFVGDVQTDSFDLLLTASDFVIIPARTWQDDALARRAISFGKPVLCTYRSRLHCVDHGQNGLIVRENLGALVGGLQDMIANPMHGSILRWLGKQKAHHTPSAESIAAEHYLAYETLLATAQVRIDG